MCGYALIYLPDDPNDSLFFLYIPNLLCKYVASYNYYLRHLEKYINYLNREKLNGEHNIQFKDELNNAVQKLALEDDIKKVELQNLVEIFISKKEKYESTKDIISGMSYEHDAAKAAENLYKKFNEYSNQEPNEIQLTHQIKSINKYNKISPVTSMNCIDALIEPKYA